MPRRPWVLLACTLVGGCEDEPTTLSLQGYNLTSDGIVVDDAWIKVAALRARPVENCTIGDENRLEAPTAVDLLAPARDLGAPAGVYCRLELDLQGRGVAGGYPSSMLDSPIFVRGTRTDGVRFTINTELDVVIALDTLGAGITVGGPELFIGIDVRAWLAEVDLDGALTGGDGDVRVSSESHTTLLDQFQANVVRGLHLFPDQDGDGVLDADETDRDDSIADSNFP